MDSAHSLAYNCSPLNESSTVKSSEMTKEDRLSELPDSLIFDIFQFLPVIDVVRTTILSKRWNNLWTTFPCLDFNGSSENMMMMMIDADKFRGFVDGALNSWRGIKIVKFVVDFRMLISRSKRKESYPTKSDIDKWVRFATDRKVEVLKLFVPVEILLPQYLYSCSSLKVLWLLSGFDLQVDGNVQWYRLKKLFIFGGSFSANSINQVMLGSPQLERFDLYFRDISENMSIRSSSLRWLIIKMMHYRDARVIGPELRIWTPNLKTLEICGIPYSKCLLMNVSSLAAACLEMNGPCIMFPGTEFVQERLSGILPSMKHVQKVILSDWCIKAIGAMKEEHMLSPFPNAEFLQLNVCSDEHKFIVGVLEMFPKLRELVLQTKYESSVPKHAESSLKFDRNLPDSFLLHLRTVDVTWTIGDDSLFPLVQFLLKYARNLEKMVFSLVNGYGDEMPASWTSLASWKLLKMVRSSPTAKLIFVDVWSC